MPSWAVFGAAERRMEGLGLMSSISTLGLTTALYIAFMVAFVFGDRWIHSRGEIVDTGLLRGIPISTEMRGLVFYNSWLTLASGMVASAALIALGFIGIARNSDDPFVRVFAYLCAFQSSFVSVVWVGTGISWFGYYRRVLRGAKRT
jgi:hypothetical protein